MPTYEYECAKHGVFEIQCHLSEWHDHKPCPKCKKSSEQILRPSRTRDWSLDPVVIHLDGNGNVRFPMAGDAPVPKGFERVELRSLPEIESFERKMNTKLRSEAAQHNENEERYFGWMQSCLRSELRQAMQHMSPAGREFAQFCIDRNNQRKRKSSEVGFHLPILHFDQVNREPYRDERTGWRKRNA